MNTFKINQFDIFSPVIVSNIMDLIDLEITEEDKLNENFNWLEDYLKNDSPITAEERLLYFEIKEEQYRKREEKKAREKFEQENPELEFC